MFVSIAIIRRGISGLSAAKAGRMASSKGRAIATPAPRNKVRRDNGRGAGEKNDDIVLGWVGWWDRGAARAGNQILIRFAAQVYFEPAKSVIMVEGPVCVTGATCACEVSEANDAAEAFRGAMRFW